MITKKTITDDDVVRCLDTVTLKGDQLHVELTPSSNGVKAELGETLTFVVTSVTRKTNTSIQRSTMNDDLLDTAITLYTSDPDHDRQPSAADSDVLQDDNGRDAFVVLRNVNSFIAAYRVDPTNDDGLVPATDDEIRELERSS